MIKNCQTIYDNIHYDKYFNKYDFELSNFQKYAIESIIENQHLLVTAHTGSGKTLPAEFAIEYYVSKGKKVIYTSPIKALSNQKFYEFSKKFPHISFGILTGDIKTNPQANVLIMTAEILLNKLYNIYKNNSVNSFDMDINNELGCVIMDEVHYINDKERGKVWEETILMLPNHIQMIMLSATLDSPDKFAKWIIDTKNLNQNQNQQKCIYLTGTNERVVPLIHYAYVTTPNKLDKIKDKKLLNVISNTTNKLHIIQDEKGRFYEDKLHMCKKVLEIIQTNKYFIKRQFVLNQILKHMNDHNMLPALCFVLSRKSLEQCANEITNVFDINSNIEHECEQIIRKLPNYNEYLNLPEYTHIVSLLKKGVAIHHAGIMPVLREMIELLFSKGYIKVLFATETFSVGINMPTKSVIFCDVNKFDGDGTRFLHSHEYTQMAGRAGRRGIDTIGYVIHLINLFRDTDITSMRSMMKGNPQMLVSKFKISYNLLLNLIDMKETNFMDYIARSMINNELNTQMELYEKQIIELTTNMKHMISYNTPDEIIQKYILLKEQEQNAKINRRKVVQREICLLLDEHINLEKDMKQYLCYNEKKNELTKIQNDLENTSKYMQIQINNTLSIMEHNGFIDCNNSLTIRGKIALQLREVHCLVFAEMIDDNKLDHLTSIDLIGLFSCFTNVSVPDEYKTYNPISDSINLNNIIKEFVENYNKYYDLELKLNVLYSTGIDYNIIHYDLMDYCIEWAKSNSESECKLVLQNLKQEKQIYLGEFVKALLKINNICNELVPILEIIGKIHLLKKITEIPELTLKYVATNQSLYI
jgi:superfamily II RNA helicase